MRRREFITLLGGAATWPIAARGQSSIPVIGFINGSSATAYAAYVQAFIRGLAEAGHTVGENVAIEYRWAEGHYDRIPDMVDDLVHRRVAVLAPNTPAARAAKRASGNIPVIFFTGEGPVASGLVASLNRPGGNVTGVTLLFGGLAAKQVGLLHDLVPAATLIGFLVNPRNPITGGMCGMRSMRRKSSARRLRSSLRAAKPRSMPRSIGCVACELARCSCSLMLFSTTSGS